VPSSILNDRKHRDLVIVDGVLGGTWRRIKDVVRRRHRREKSSENFETSVENTLPAKIEHIPVAFPAFEEEDVVDELSLSDVLLEIDELHRTKQYIEALRRLDELVEDGESSAEVLWRLARVCCDLSDKASNDIEKEKFVRKGLAAAETAVKNDPESGLASKWYGIMLGLVADFESVKVKIKNSQKIKDALDHANQKLPNDPTVKLALGQWSLKLAGIGFIERQVAKTFFAAPPQASYKDALHFFEESHALKPSPRTSSLIKLTKKKIRLT